MNSKCYPNFGILLVDDEKSFLHSLSITLERSGLNHLYLCDKSQEVMQRLEDDSIGLVLLDLTMPGISGEQLLKQISEERPDLGVIVISGLNQVDTAVKCIHLGAMDYYVKTEEPERLVKGIKRIIRLLELQHENQLLRQHFLDNTLEQPEAFAKIKTNDKKMRSVFQYLEAVSNSNQPILISGESGVGKELIVEAVHSLSHCSGDLISFNVAGLDDNMLADTLFGHVRGAYTGADSARKGMIEQAENGTLFLDEIGDLSLASQVKLLRLLQEGEYFPLGSDRVKRIHARVIVATHQNLAKQLQEGKFRKDLFYRLKTHSVQIPALRERKGDIPILLDYFLQDSANQLNKKVPTIPKELPVLLRNYTFPGNVRELKAMVHDAMTTHNSRMLSMDVFKRAMDTEIEFKDDDNSLLDTIFNEQQQLPKLNEVQNMLIDEAMNRAEGRQSIASRMLGISQPALSKRLKKKQ